MTAPKDKGGFLRLLEQSGLVDKDDLLKIVRETAGVADTAAEISDWLMEKKWINEYHSFHLLAGRYKGFLIGPYRIMSARRSSHTAHWYGAQHRTTGKRVMIKIFDQELPPASLTRALDAARDMAAYVIPGVVEVYGVEQDGSLSYVVLEHLQYWTIDELVSRFGPISWQAASIYVLQAANLLESGRRCCRLHGALQPDCLLVDQYNELRLVDLGMPSFFDEPVKPSETAAADAKKNSGLFFRWWDACKRFCKPLPKVPILDNVDYLSPEQAADRWNFDARSEIYSLGAVFYFMLTGKPPFPDGSPAEKLRARQTASPRPIQELVPQLPSPIADALMRMLATNPADRYSTAHDFYWAFHPVVTRLIDRRRWSLDDAGVGPTTKVDLLNLLESSGLLEPSACPPSIWKIQHEVATLVDDPRVVCDWLVEHKTITRHQASRLLNGCTRGYVVGGSPGYTLLEPLDDYGVRNVYQAKYQGLADRPVAVLVERSELVPTSSESLDLARKINEGKFLNHENLIQYHELIDDGDLFCIVMEYFAGRSLLQGVSDFGAIPWMQAIEVLVQLADALAIANRAGLYHGAIHPGMIFVNTSGSVRLFGLGLASLRIPCFEPPRRQTNPSFEPFRYLAPEQTENRSMGDIRSDIYSIGAVVRYMLTGQSSLAASDDRQADPRKTDFEWIEKIAPPLPPALKEVLRRMLALNPVDRYSTPDELLGELKPHFDGNRRSWNDP